MKWLRAWTHGATSQPVCHYKRKCMQLLLTSLSPTGSTVGLHSFSTKMIIIIIPSEARFPLGTWPRSYGFKVYVANLKIVALAHYSHSSSLAVADPRGGSMGSKDPPSF